MLRLLIPPPRRDADERHATLRATITWSYDLLDDDEQQLFVRLAVLRCGSTPPVLRVDGPACARARTEGLLSIAEAAGLDAR